MLFIIVSTEKAEEVIRNLGNLLIKTVKDKSFRYHNHKLSEALEHLDEHMLERYVGIEITFDVCWNDDEDEYDLDCAVKELEYTMKSYNLNAVVMETLNIEIDFGAITPLPLLWPYGPYQLYDVAPYCLWYRVPVEYTLSLNIVQPLILRMMKVPFLSNTIIPICQYENPIQLIKELGIDRYASHLEFITYENSAIARFKVLDEYIKIVMIDIDNARKNYLGGEY